MDNVQNNNDIYTDELTSEEKSTTYSNQSLAKGIASWYIYYPAANLM